MGIFGDLFKAKDWSIKEMYAILSVMTAMGAIDGKIDEDEKKIATEMLTRLPGSESVDWDTFAKNAAIMDAQEAYSTLKNMRKNKRDVAIAMLYGVAQADGNVDDKEYEFFMNVARVLNIDM